MSKTILKPCPFCGGKAVFIESWNFVAYVTRIQCTKCAISTQPMRKGTATRRWNRRVKSAQKDEHFPERRGL